MSRKDKKVGLALGGGGVRGMAHLGVLDVLEKNNIRIDAIAGSSMGAIVGAAYTLDSDYSGEHLTSVFRQLEPYVPLILKTGSSSTASAFQKIGRYINAAYFLIDTLIGWGPLSSDVSKKLLHSITGDKLIEDSGIPIAIVSVDMISGNKVVFMEGRADLALQASSAIPGYFPPVPMGNQLLMDGGILDKVPVDVVRDMNVDKVIAVDVDQYSSPENIYNGAEACIRAIELCTRHNKHQVLKQADLVISPHFDRPIKTLDTSKTAICIEAGMKAAESALPDIKKMLEIH